MTLHLYAENNDGDIVEVTDRLRADTLEVAQQAEEASTGASVIVLDDPDGSFYIRAHKPLYLVEDDAGDDPWFGLIGLFFADQRTFQRGDARTEAGREVHISVNDVNTLLTRRVQKGADAKRPQENDTTRIPWLLGTPEFVGGYSVDNTDYVFLDSPQPMSETDYTSQDSSGVINDALQDSGKNAYLFPSPTDTDPLRLGMWYGRTEREDYASPHRISNYLEDISPETLDPEWMFDPVIDYETDEWTFAPSIDANLERDGSRVASGVMVMADGGYAYERRPETATAFAQRDMVMQAELVKTVAQAQRRAARYVRDLRNEDDAITCTVIVPNAGVNFFVQGQRVQVRFSYMPGYSADFVWLRVARRTVRQLSSGSGLYELSLDLRAEEPPDSGSTGTGDEPCTDLTPAGTYYPLGGSVDTPNPSDGVVYYWNPGEPRPIEPEDMLGEVGHWHFPAYGAGGASTVDYAGGCTQSNLRLMVRGNGTMTVNLTSDPGQTFRAILSHHQYGEGEEGNPNSGVDVTDQVWYQQDVNTLFEVAISTHGGENCTHWLDIKDDGGNAYCGSGVGFVSMAWDPD